MGKWSDAGGEDDIPRFERASIFQVELEDITMASQGFDIGGINVRNGVLLEPATIVEKVGQRDGLLFVGMGDCCIFIDAIFASGIGEADGAPEGFQIHLWRHFLPEFHGFSEDMHGQVVGFEMGRYGESIGPGADNDCGIGMLHFQHAPYTGTSQDRYKALSLRVWSFACYTVISKEYRLVSRTDKW